MSSEWSRFLPLAIPFARVGLDQIVMDSADWAEANARVQARAKEFLDALDESQVLDLLRDWE